MQRLSVWFCCGGYLGELSLKKLAKNPRWHITAIWTDKKSQGIINWAQESKIPLHIGRPPKRFSSQDKPKADVLLSVNYLFLFSKNLLALVPMAINIHGSLLPKYMGRTPNTWAIINDEIETGITIHEMIEEVDAGDILYQEKMSISNTDSGWSLIERMGHRYPIILNKVLTDIAQGKIKRQSQDWDKRSYCGKREPSDGLIDWRWSARKVYNWVRAQTKPYPGAFGYVNGKKYRFWLVEEMYEGVNRRKAGDHFKLNGKMCVTCGQGVIRLLDYELAEG